MIIYKINNSLDAGSFSSDHIYPSCFELERAYDLEKKSLAPRKNEEIDEITQTESLT